MKSILILIVFCCIGISIELSNNTIQDLTELLEEAVGSEDGYKTANQIYKNKYGDSLVKIYTVPIQGKEKYLMIDNNIIFNHEMAEKYLRAFGSSIKRLEIVYDFIPEHWRKEMGKLVSEYCSETLLELTIRSCKNGDFDEIRKPFQKVESIDLNGEWSEVDEESWMLNELFPMLKNLNLTYSGGYIYNHNYHNLIELNVFSSAFNQFKRLINKNPQIRKLRLQETSMEVLRTISDRLHELEVLNFNIPSDLESYEGPAIQFDTVKTIAIKDCHRKFNHKQLKFKQLQQLHLHVIEKFNEEWIEFIGSNKDLKTLKMTAGNFNNATLSMLSEKLNSLIEANINCESNVDADGVKKFVESNKNMKAIVLTCPRLSEELFKQLSEKFNKDWSITTENKEYSILNIKKTGSEDVSSEATISTDHSQEQPDTTVGDSQNATEIATDQNATNTTNTDNGVSTMCSSTVLTVAIFAILATVFDL